MVKVNHLCTVDYGSHIGEYIKQKLRARGLMQIWLVEQVKSTGKNMTKQSLNHLLSKAEMYPSEIEMLALHLPDDFFDEFYEHNPEIKKYMIPRKEDPQVAENISGYETRWSGPAYTLKIEIDPENFNPQHLSILSESLKKALEDFQKKIADKK